MSHPTITRNNFSDLEEEYIRLKEVHSRFPSKVNNWSDLLDTDKEGDPIYPERGMPESRYNPDNEDIARKASLIEVLKYTKDALAHFIISLPADEQINIVQETMLPLLKNLDAQSICNAGDQDDEDDMNTVVNGEDNGAGEEIPQEEENNILNQGGDNPVPTPPRSPRNSRGSSKSLKIEGKSYQMYSQQASSGCL